ncbi:hypothetical protein PENTCL1PPCAC_24567, partial [Pristionchus entomophagus]
LAFRLGRSVAEKRGLTNLNSGRKEDRFYPPSSSMSPRISDEERDVVLNLILERRKLLIEHRCSRNGDINQERNDGWKGVLVESRRKLRNKDMTMTRVRNIFDSSMKQVRVIGQLTQRSNNI